MQGNREAYIKRASMFVEKIEIPSDPYEAEKFIKEFNIRLDSFEKATSKAYNVLQEFFANESYKIGQDIKSMDRIIKNITEQVKNSGFAKIDEGRSSITRINNSIAKRDEIRNKRQGLKKEIAELKEKMRVNEQEMDTLKTSDDFKELAALEQKKSALKEQKEELEHEIGLMISSIAPALKKYSRISLEREKLCKDYLFAPVKTFENDSGLEILKIAEGLKNAITDSSLELKDKKKDKMLANIDQISAERVAEISKRIYDIETQVKELSQRISDSAVRDRYKELKKKHEKLKKDLKGAKTNLNLASRALQDIDIGKLAHDAEEKLARISGRKVNIILPNSQAESQAGQADDVKKADFSAQAGKNHPKDQAVGEDDR
ncbi:hypothetical protein GF351_03435 [Candidatus Woesearchaeota archaeon]|nr:hypothetical protein [Candidatus Woesearchaeota archaeon]